MAVGFIQYDPATGKKTVVSTIPSAGVSFAVVADEIAGETLTTGDVVAKTAGNNLYRANAAGLDETRIAIGLILSGAASGSSARVGLLGEFIQSVLNYAVASIGAVIYVPTGLPVPNAPATPPPSASGSGQQKFGSVIQTNGVKINPEPQVYIV